MAEPGFKLPAREVLPIVLFPRCSLAINACSLNAPKMQLLAFLNRGCTLESYGEMNFFFSLSNPITRKFDLIG